MKQVHLIFKTHLDLGFTDTAARVTERYLDEFIPRALDLAEESRLAGKDRFIWSTGSWLIHEFLEHGDYRRMEKAIELGDIAWHALPFTTHTELLDASLLRLGLSLSRKLDERFGRKTIAAKMTDVPGHTRSMVPILAEAGIQLLHIGVNPASTVPDVPPIFRWVSPDGSELITIVEGSYGDVVSLPDGESAVATNFTGDNMGPHSLSSIGDVYRRLEEEFPGARVEATVLDEVAKAIIPYRDTLPMVTSEIGDTWIHGVGTDPTKVRRFRELGRLRQTWIANGLLEEQSELDQSFAWPLLKIAEHTWGMDEKTHLDDYEAYSGPSFGRLRESDKCKAFEASWSEQRAYIGDAIDALEGTPLQSMARETLDSSEPKYPRFDGFTRLAKQLDWQRTSHWQFQLGPEGAFCGLVHLKTGAVLASQACQLGTVRYQAFAATDYDRFCEQYVRGDYDWAIKDFTKPGIETLEVKAGVWSLCMKSLWQKGDRFYVEMEPNATVPLGCPRHFILEINAEEDALQLSLQWFNKAPNRLPEAIWFGFHFDEPLTGGYALRKLGSWVQPLDVVRNGNRNLHALDDLLICEDTKKRVRMASLDAPLVAMGEPSLLDFTNVIPDLTQGIAFNLYNNVWGTNFPMWFSDDARFRFSLSMERTEGNIE